MFDVFSVAPLLLLVNMFFYFLAHYV